MSEPEQCIICLDPLPRPSPPTLEAAGLEVPPSTTDANTSAVTTAPAAATENTPATSLPIAADAGEDEDSYLNIVAALDGCEHVIHDACIRSWAQKTNTCPICRNPFHSVRVYNGVDGESTPSFPVRLPPLTLTFQAPQSLHTTSKTRSKSPSSMFSNGWATTPRRRKKRATRARYAAQPKAKTSSFSATAATQPTIPTASASSTSPMATGTAWNVRTSSSSPRSPSPLISSSGHLGPNKSGDHTREAFGGSTSVPGRA